MEEKVEKRKSYQGEVKKRLPPLNRFLNQTEGSFFLGIKPTYVDFLFFEFLDYVRLLEKGSEIFKDTPAILKFLEAFENLPNIKRYLKSDRFKPFPIFGERSYIGRKPGDAPKL